jgi:N-formylglutamate deformylase
MWSYPHDSCALPLVTTAIHAGHELRPEVADAMRLDPATRLREEDPFTNRVAAAAGTPVIVPRSRFEVDLNRPREAAVYRTPDDAWGLEVWKAPLDERVVARSLHVYDAFYKSMAALLDDLAARGPVLLFDVHSYNHRRDGADAPPAPVSGNPEVNVGTGSLDRGRWGDVVDCFMEELGRHEARGHALDVRENVRFRGGHLSRWVNERYEGAGCALAIELKKVFMDEWTGSLDGAHLHDLVEAFAAVLPLTVGTMICSVR